MVVTTLRPTSVYADSADGSPRLAELPGGVALRVLDARERRLTLWRLKVLLPGAAGLEDATVWVDMENVQPMAAAPGPAPVLNYAGNRTQFIEAVALAARGPHEESGVPVSVTVAQAILESNWGESLLARRANNLFGMKGAGSGGIIWMPTAEFVRDKNGTERAIKLLQPFRAYRGLEDSVADHNRLFMRLSRYASALEARQDPSEFARRIAAGGYSTDPKYPEKLIGLIREHDLTRFDR